MAVGRRMSRRAFSQVSRAHRTSTICAAINDDLRPFGGAQMTYSAPAESPYAGRAAEPSDMPGLA
jgi:hypothetical protein